MSQRNFLSTSDFTSSSEEPAPAPKREVICVSDAETTDVSYSTWDEADLEREDGSIVSVLMPAHHRECEPVDPLPAWVIEMLREKADRFYEAQPRPPMVGNMPRIPNLVYWDD
jgi:hypothetical protein